MTPSPSSALSPGLRAYVRRQTGETWAQVAATIGLPSAEAAMTVAQAWSREIPPYQLTRMPWPPIVDDSRSHGQHSADMGRDAYDRRRTGEPWADIGEAHGVSSSTAYGVARVYARQANLPWPVVVACQEVA